MRKPRDPGLDDHLRAYDQGPFPALRIEPSDLLVAVYEARTGRLFPHEVILDYERARAYTGGFVVPHALERFTAPLASPDDPTTVGAGDRAPTGITGSAQRVDPEDLGD